MSAPTDALRRERLDTVLALAAPHVPAERRPMFEGFAREYFRRLDDDDFAARAPEDLSGALLSHWQFGAMRVPGKPKVRVLNPSVADDGGPFPHQPHRRPARAAAAPRCLRQSRLRRWLPRCRLDENTILLRCANRKTGGNSGAVKA